MSSTPDTPVGTGRPPVVLVDRDRHVRALVSLFLTREGFEVEFAETGHLGLERVRRHGWAVLITEILIPELDGLSLCRLVKQDAGLKTAVIVLSMLSADERARQSGADAFLMKPVAEKRLISTVRTLATTLSREGRAT